MKEAKASDIFYQNKKWNTNGRTVVFQQVSGKNVEISNFFVQESSNTLKPLFSDIYQQQELLYTLEDVKGKYTTYYVAFVPRTSKYYTYWILQKLAKRLFDEGTRADTDRFVEACKRSVIDTVLDKFEYTTVDDKSFTVSIKPQAIRDTSQLLSQQLTREQTEALNVLDKYESDNHCAIFYNAAYKTNIGMNYLLGKHFFQLHKYNGLQYAKTPEIHRAEVGISTILSTLKSKSHHVQLLEDDSHVLTSDQQSALDMINQSSVSILTGFPGTGKTYTICNSICPGSRILFLTPSHKAKRVIRANLPSQHVAAEVIHFAGYYAFKHMKQDSKFPETGRLHDMLTSLGFHSIQEARQRLDAIIFDETSMIDVLILAQTLTLAIQVFPNLKRIVFLGDKNQLKSVDKGNVLDDLIVSQTFPTINLTKIMRSNGNLSTNIPLIVQGRFKDVTFGDDTFQLHTHPDNVVNVLKAKGKYRAIPLVEIVDFYIDRQDTQIIAYQNADCAAINLEIMKRLFNTTELLTRGALILCRKDFCSESKSSLGKRKASSSTEDSTEDFILDDSIDIDIHDDDTSKIYKGELYTITNIFGSRITLQDKQQGNNIVLDVPSSREFQKHIDLGYASTAHSFQGGQALLVLVVAAPFFYFDRDAFYTMVSRAQEQAHIFQVEEDDYITIIKQKPRIRISCLPMEL
jgi:hypothetical protein